MRIQCVSHGLTETEKKCVRIIDDCHTRRVTYREVVTGLKELRERLQDELESELFLHLYGRQAGLYEKPKQRWEEVISPIPEGAARH
jgi:hypothetical protein